MDPLQNQNNQNQSTESIPVAGPVMPPVQAVAPIPSNKSSFHKKAVILGLIVIVVMSGSVGAWQLTRKDTPPPPAAPVVADHDADDHTDVDHEESDTESTEPAPAPELAPAQAAPAPKPKPSTSTEQKPAPAPTTPPSSPPPEEQPQPTTHAVTYSGSGFSPNSLTIKKGDTVNFTNNGGGGMWVASDPHPSHTDYPAFLSDKTYNSGQTFSFTFTLTGTWGYHNHLASNHTGTVVVQ